jgi:hypothetical protein
MLRRFRSWQRGRANGPGVFVAAVPPSYERRDHPVDATVELCRKIFSAAAALFFVHLQTLSGLWRTDGRKSPLRLDRSNEQSHRGD